MHSLCYRGDTCGVILFLPPHLILPGLLGSWMGKEPGSMPCIPAGGPGGLGVLSVVGITPITPLLCVPSSAGTGLNPHTSCTLFSLQGTFLLPAWTESCQCFIRPCFSSISWSVAGPVDLPWVSVTCHGAAGVLCLQHHPSVQCGPC